MSAPLAHLHALAQCTLDAHAIRAGELRGRLAPVLAAGMAGAALLTPQALDAIGTGRPLSVAAFLLTLMVAFRTALAIGLFLSTDLRAAPLEPAAVKTFLAERGALDRERLFHETMITLVSDACADVGTEVEVLNRQFTVIMCGILFALCGLALTAVIAC